MPEHILNQQLPEGGTAESGVQAPYANLKRFRDIKPEQLRWLWPNRIPLGMLTVLSGNPGIGKTFVVADLAARISTGSDFPDAPNGHGPGSVLFLNLEDHLSATQRPRLDAASADTNKVVTISSVSVANEDGSETTEFLSLETLPEAIRSAAEQLGDLRLVVVDPLAEVLAGVNGNESGPVRQALRPLIQLAEELEIAIVLVHHNRKGTGSHSSERLSGSLQIGATVRTIWEFFLDPNNEERRLFLPGKNANAKQSGGLAFRVVDSWVSQSDANDWVGQVQWERDPVNLTANDLAEQTADEDSRDPFPVEWLRDFLSNGPVANTDVTSAARKAGISDKQLRTAGSRLKIERKKGSFAGGWIWQLPSA